MKRIDLALLAAILMLTTIAAPAVTPLVSRLLPTPNQAKGLKVVSGSLIYGRGPALADIYNGGYEIYVDYGVIDAAQQLYTRENDFYEVTVHSFKSPRAALDFLSYWQKKNKITKTEKTSASVGFVRIGTTPGAFYATKSFLTIVIASTSKANPTAKEQRAMAFQSRTLAMVVESNVKRLAK